MIQRIKGTQDWLDLKLFNFVLDQIKKHLTFYNFTEIKTPILEPTELFKRSLGVATDVVSKEMFIIKTEKNDDVMCLRPEATASTVRAFIENSVVDVPWKVFSWGSMFRYERPQKGRYREFHQINIENIGASSIGNDAELIKMLDRFFHEKLKLENYALMVNFLGSFQDRANYKNILKTFLESDACAGICETCKERKDANTLRVFDCKNPECQKLYENAPKMVDHLSVESQKEWQELQQQLELLSVSFIINPKLVRGLDYYNKTVFEFSSNDLGAQNTFCAGGRYDALVKELGAKQDQPALGAAIGIERLLLLLEPNQDRLPIAQSSKLTVIIPVAEEQRMLAMLIADELHAQELCAQVMLDGGKVKKMMQKANKMGATYAVIVGEDEQHNHEVTLKNMTSGAEDRVKQVDLVNILKG
ncbi:MAG: histidine--tRNA ligase [Candidatus Dependentiae bacterium]